MNKIEPLISDSQLRQELLQLGVNVGPITSTTRSVYMKRLEKLKFKVPAPAKSNTRKVLNGSRNGVGFSSDESDQDSKVRKKKVVHSRRSSVRKKVPVSSSESKQFENTSPTVIDNKYVSKTKRQNPPTFAASSPISFSDNEESVNLVDRVDWIEYEAANISTSPLSPNDLESSCNDLERYSDTLLENNCSTPNATHINNPGNNGDSERTTALAKPTKSNSSLVNLKRRKLYPSLNNLNSLPPKTNATGISENNNSLNQALQDRPCFRNYCTSISNHIQKIWSLQYCSLLLPIAMVVFFTILGLLYFAMRSDDMSPGVELLVKHVKSHPQDNLDKTMVTVLEISKVLTKASGDFICKYSDKKELFISEVQSYCQVSSTSFTSALELIQSHPEWDITLLKTKQDVLQKNESVKLVSYLSSKQSKLPTWCRLRRAVENVLLQISCVAFVGLLGWAVIMYRGYKSEKMQKEKQEMFALVDKVIDLLKTHHAENMDEDSTQSPALPIFHVRDIIIPPQDRTRLAKVWEKAVHFLSASESRLRVETKRIAGEDYRTWRWIQVRSLTKQPLARVWQGEAFDTSKTYKNSTNIGYTPCLKIRNMFDPEAEKGDAWQMEIQDSILEKCTESHDILSIVVEKKSNEGLVYIKCGSKESAGKVFMSLHGSWFGGRLVTAKYIKLNRFHSRYPMTESCTTPLKHSSAKSVSSFIPSTPPSSNNSLHSSFTAAS